MPENEAPSTGVGPELRIIAQKPVSEQRPLTIIDHRSIQRPQTPSLDTAAEPLTSPPTENVGTPPEVSPDPGTATAPVEEPESNLANPESSSIDLNIQFSELAALTDDELRAQKTHVLKDMITELAMTSEEPLAQHLANIRPEFRALVEEVVTEALNDREAAQVQLEKNIEAALKDSSLPSAEAERAIEALDLGKVTTERAENGLILAGQTAGGLQEVKTFIKDSWQSILPTLLAFDGVVSMLGGRQPQLGMLLRQIDEFKNGPETSEDILLKMNVDPDIISHLKDEKVIHRFFEHFVKDKDRLMYFFSRMTSTSGNMFLFLEKMPEVDIQRMVDRRLLPADIPLEPEELETILGKMRPYERQKLGIHPYEAKMLH